MWLCQLDEIRAVSRALGFVPFLSFGQTLPAVWVIFPAVKVYLALGQTLLSSLWHVILHTPLQLSPML